MFFAVVFETILGLVLFTANPIIFLRVNCVYLRGRRSTFLGRHRLDLLHILAKTHFEHYRSIFTCTDWNWVAGKCSLEFFFVFLVAYFVVFFVQAYA